MNLKKKTTRTVPLISVYHQVPGVTNLFSYTQTFRCFFLPSLQTTHTLILAYLASITTHIYSAICHSGMHCSFAIIALTTHSAPARPLSLSFSPIHTHTHKLFSRSSDQWQTHHDSSRFSVTSASQTFIPAVTSCLTATLNINSLLWSFPGSTCIKIQITKRKKANKWLICASKNWEDKALTSENMSEGLWVTFLCFGS